jgi:glycosyltransferase involved in cell wall biosynthesis
MYQNCLALLIPLRPTLQDIARFPHKIGEYTASKRPIISTNIGEVSIFFKDGENAFLSESFEVNNYSKKMQEVIDFPSKREVVAEQSFLTGIKDFNYKTNSERLYEFLFTK